VFFAERECGRVPGLAAAGTREIRKAVVVGAGTMGTGIAMALADAGIDFAYPAVGVTASGRGIIAFTATGADTYPSAAYARRAA